MCALPISRGGRPRDHFCWPGDSADNEAPPGWRGAIPAVLVVPAAAGDPDAAVDRDVLRLRAHCLARRKPARLDRVGGRAGGAALPALAQAPPAGDGAGAVPLCRLGPYAVWLHPGSGASHPALLAVACMVARGT